MSDALAHHGQLNWLSASHCADNFLSNARVHILRVEGHLQIQIRVRVHVPLGRRDGEVLGELASVPLKVGLDVSEIAHLKSLGETAVVDNLTE